MNARRWIGSAVLLLLLAGAGAGVEGWKRSSRAEAAKSSALAAEPAEVVTVALARERRHVEKATVVGTVLALQSITVRIELPGTVRETALVPGRIVDAGEVLVRLDVSVEEAELRSQEAQSTLAETLLARVERASRNGAASDMELDRARAERDVARAQVARTRAVIDRKTVRAPFRARVGLADLHPGQYLSEGTVLTTLQSVEEAAHVDFTVSQGVAAALRPGAEVEIVPSPSAAPIAAQVVAVDARVDPSTRNAAVRARIDGSAPVPGSSVRVRVPVGPPIPAVAVPANALRKGPDGDFVFVVHPGQDMKPRAHLRRIRSGALLGDEVLILEGIAAGDRVAASGSFKLRDGALVAAASEPVKVAGLAR